MTLSYKKTTDIKPKPTRKEAPRPDYHANVVVRVQRLGVKAVRRQLVAGRGPLQDKHLTVPGRIVEGKVYYEENPPKETKWRRQGLINDYDVLSNHYYTAKQAIVFICQEVDKCGKACQRTLTRGTIESIASSGEGIEYLNIGNEHDRNMKRNCWSNPTFCERDKVDKNNYDRGLCHDTATTDKDTNERVTLDVITNNDPSPKARAESDDTKAMNVVFHDVESSPRVHPSYYSHSWWYYYSWYYHVWLWTLVWRMNETRRIGWIPSCCPSCCY